VANVCRLCRVRHNRHTFERWYPGLNPDIELPQDAAA
jgi:hypothetical protein